MLLVSFITLLWPWFSLSIQPLFIPFVLFPFASSLIASFLHFITLLSSRRKEKDTTLNRSFQFLSFNSMKQTRLHFISLFCFIVIKMKEKWIQEKPIKKIPVIICVLFLFSFNLIHASTHSSFHCN